MTFFECDCCQATYTGTWHDLVRLGWVRHKERKAEILLCRECVAMFAARRAMKRKLDEAA